MRFKLTKALIVVVLLTMGVTSGGEEKSISIAQVWQVLPEEGSACDSDDLGYDYGIGGGMRNFFCRVMTVYSWRAFITAAPVMPFRKGPHRDGKLNLNAEHDFGYYNPTFVTWATNALIPAADTPLLKQLTQDTYDKQVKYLANLYFVVDQKMRAYPDWTEHERQRYLDSIDERGAARNASDTTWAYHGFLDDMQYDPNHVRSAVMWWLRRHQDATAALWRAGLVKLLTVYDTEWLVEQNQLGMQKDWPARPLPLVPEYK